MLASNYRGGGGSDGVDEWGGRDVDDVMNLIPLARDLGYIDMANLFMIGMSRGGPMTYIALRRKFPANAAAVISGVTDLRRETRRAEFVEGDDPAFRRMGWPGWRKVYEVVVYANDGHSLPRHRKDRDAHIIDWFKAHMRCAP